MKALLVAIAAWAAIGLAGAQSPPATPLKITTASRPEAIKPTEITADVGSLVRLTSSDPKSTWELCPDSVFGADLELAADGRALFSASRPGRYLVQNRVGDRATAWAAIVVGGTPPTPMPPNPNPPSPTPPSPTPPQPEPKPPAISPAAKRLLAAIEQDGGIRENRESLAKLQALCKVAVDEATSPESRYAGDVAGRINTAAKKLAKDSVPATRKWLESELRSLVGESDYFLSESRRTELAQALARLGSTFEEVLR